MEKEREGLLSPYRVLDLTDEKGLLCAKVLADLGADVIKVEPPGGSSARTIGPFYNDIPHPEKSLFWFAYNANKRGITLNIECEDGREILKKLVATADIVIESFHPGYMKGQSPRDHGFYNPLWTGWSLQGFSGIGSGLLVHGGLCLSHG